MINDQQSNPAYQMRPLPPSLAGLAELAIDVRWNWNHSADTLWETVHPRMWEATGNAWIILESVSQRRLEELAEDEGFVAELQRLLRTKREYLSEPTWFSQTHGSDDLGTVAYFSMEFGLGEALPIYSGGLGILAGDHLKTASDLGLPLIGIGLLYQQGYFRQALDAAGKQLAFYPFNDPTLLPVLPLRNVEGEWLQVHVELPGRRLYLRGWDIRVGRNRLLLLDSNHPLNTARDRGITSELYGGNPETRLEQEMVLGIGGWRLLVALGLECAVCHLNEGHAAFALLERARHLMEQTGLPFDVALRCGAAGNVFTTHTSVSAAFDRFPPELIQQYFCEYAEALGLSMEEFLQLGKSGEASEQFNMAYLAVRGCNRINGVSRLHGEVSRAIFQPIFPRWPRREVPVRHITNGVHMPSWDSAAADALWTETCGKDRWHGTLANLEESFRQLNDEALWDFCSSERRSMLFGLRKRLERQQRARGERPAGRHPFASVLDPNALTLGFARRFAAYKRPDLLLYDPERLVRLLSNSRCPVQLVVAGKAHPADDIGKRMVRQWAEFMRRKEVQGRMVFIEDYDIGLAAELVQGIDLWINTPRRPWEASGTSGMKVLINGGLNLSELDGWWAEAYSPEVGWALGDGQEHGDSAEWDWQEARQLYELLEQEVIPAFYQRDERGIPRAWIGRVRESMSRLTPQFSTNRMVREYTEYEYLPAAAEYRRRFADQGQMAQEIEQWREAVGLYWEQVHFGQMGIERQGEQYSLWAQVYLNELGPEMVQAQVFSEPVGDNPQTLWPMERTRKLAGAVNGFVYQAQLPADRPSDYYTPRIIPHHPAAVVPLEATQILWAR